jgi:hypothetical protein
VFDQGFMSAFLIDNNEGRFSSHLALGAGMTSYRVIRPGQKVHVPGTLGCGSASGLSFGDRSMDESGLPARDGKDSFTDLRLRVPPEQSELDVRHIGHFICRNDCIDDGRAIAS